MDNEELEAAIDALDTLHFTVLSLVSSTNTPNYTRAMMSFWSCSSIALPSMLIG